VFVSARAVKFPRGRLPCGLARDSGGLALALALRLAAFPDCRRHRTMAPRGCGRELDFEFIQLVPLRLGL